MFPTFKVDREIFTFYSTLIWYSELQSLLQTLVSQIRPHDDSFLRHPELRLDLTRKIGALRLGNLQTFIHFGSLEHASLSLDTSWTHQFTRLQSILIIKSFGQSVQVQPIRDHGSDITTITSPIWYAFSLWWPSRTYLYCLVMFCRWFWILDKELISCLVGGNAVSAFLSWRLSATNACDVTLVWKSSYQQVAQFGISFK